MAHRSRKLVGATLLLLLMPVASVYAASDEQGITSSQLVSSIGLLAAVGAIILLVVAEFVLKQRLRRSTYHWMLLVGLFLLPVMSVMGATTKMFEDTKTVESCNSCHVMDVFVEDMRDPDSATLAARHYKHKWIPEKQCYTCHTTYGLHGTVDAKVDGLRHWTLYVTDSWPEPIQFRGSYPNSTCLGCHSGTPAFAAVQSHSALDQKLLSDEVSCASCHGPPHPAPPERPATR